MNKKSKTEIFFGLLLLIVAFALGMVLKNDTRLTATLNQPAVQQGGIDAAMVPVTETIKNNPAQQVGQCYVGGCSGQLCSDNPNAISTCEFTDAYACYKTGVTTCERQPSGQCGWTQTPALAQCLNDHPSQTQ